MSKQTINTSEYLVPHFNKIKKVSPRIEYFDGKEWHLAGSGILFKGNGQYYVITAAHCIGKDVESYVSEANLRIVLGKDYKVTKVIKYESSSEIDFAMMSVDFVKDDCNEFDYENGLRFIGCDIDTHGTDIVISGHDKTHLTGHNLTGHCCAEKTYRLNDHYTADSKDLGVIHGFSGGGVFTEKDSVLYCMGYVKNIKTKQQDLDDIEIRYIPDLGFSDLWMAAMPNDFEPVSESYGNNKPQQDYYKAWNNLYDFLSGESANDAKYSELLQKVEDAKQLYPRPKSIGIQDSVERLLFYDHSNFPGRDVHGNEPKAWTENDKRTLILAMRDMGVWPSLYALRHPGLVDLNKKEYAQKMLQRASTITADCSIERFEPDISTDEGRYELIMRSAFNLDFTRMKKLVDEWQPSDAWLPKKVMLESLWYSPSEDIALSADLAKLKRTIESDAYNNENKFIACVIYNCCKRVFPNEIKYEEFHVAGINSPEEVISYIAGRIDRVKTAPIPYGIYTDTLYESVGTDSFPESLRIIQYLIDTGLLASSGMGDIVNVEIWMKVFRHLFHNFPGALVFYTLTYAQNKLSTLCGQHMAFTTDSEFVEWRKDLLNRILKAIDCDETPGRFYQGLYQMAMELFPVIAPDAWFESFNHAVTKILSTVEIERLTVRNSITQFIGEGILHLTDNTQKKEILSLINGYFDKNPLSLSYLLSWSLTFDNDLVKDDEVNTVLKEMIEKYPLSKTYSLLRRIDSSGHLTPELKRAIESKLNDEGFEFAKDNLDALVLLSGLVCEDANILALKKVILESWNQNYWDCGISGNTFSSKGFLPLDEMNERIIYDDGELKAIMDNMRTNIEIIRNVPNNNLFDSHISHHVAELLLSMKTFINKSKIRPRVDHDTLNKEIDNLILATFKKDSIIGLLSSGNFYDVKNAIHLLYQLIDADNIGKFKNEINFLIHMGIMKVKDAIELSINFISYLIKEYPQHMVSEFGESLKILVRNYFDFDYEELHVHALNVRKNLAVIESIITE